MKVRHVFIGEITKELDNYLNTARNLESQFKGENLKQQVRLAPKYLAAKKKLDPYYTLAQHCIDKWSTHQCSILTEVIYAVYMEAVHSLS